MSEEARPQIPISGIVYGEIVYWGTILGSIIAIIGSTIAVVTTDNYLDTGRLFTGMWQGHTPAVIWESAVGAQPQGHWYLRHIFDGAGMAMFGLAFSVFSVIPGMFGSAIVLFREKNNLFGWMAIIGGIISTIAFLGLISLPR